MFKTDRLVAMVCLFFYFSTASANELETTKKCFAGNKNTYTNFSDSLPKTINDTIVVPFEYQQSSLNYTYTFKMIDSAIDILLKKDSVTISIDGYSHVEEANSNICYWLSMNRALAVKSYVIGRGVDSSRIDTLQALSSRRSIQRKAKKQAVKFNCTAEIVLKYPVPLPPGMVHDMDEDGIIDAEDSCVNEYGDKAYNGCPNKDAIIVPFEQQQYSLNSITYIVLDSVIALMRKDPLITISIAGHAYKNEGNETLCNQLAEERADIVRRYLLTRQIDTSRIDAVKGYGTLHPITAGRNSWEISRNSRAEIFLNHH